jgi:hypothetical protein
MAKPEPILWFDLREILSGCMVPLTHTTCKKMEKTAQLTILENVILTIVSSLVLHSRRKCSSDKRDAALVR